MKPTTNRIAVALATLAFVLTLHGCAAIKGISDALTNLQRLQFKLDNVNGFTLNNNINLSNINSLSDIGVAEGIGLLSAFQSKRMPASFTVNVLARNPNDGSNGKSATPLYLSRISWRLLIDDRETIAGVTNNRLTIPGSGQSTVIPMQFTLDLFQFFGNNGYNDVINLALALGGRQGSSSRLKLLARVTVEHDLFGKFEYPNELTIVNTQFTN